MNDKPLNPHNRLRCELLDEALPTLPLYKRALIPSWRVWDVMQAHEWRVQLPLGPADMLAPAVERAADAQPLDELEISGHGVPRNSETGALVRP